MRLGLFGYGYQGKRHARTVWGSNHEIGIFDPALAGSVPEAVLTSWADAFIIAAPTLEHRGLLERLVPTGKRILCEKPLGCLPPDEVRALPETVSVALQYRFAPFFAPIAASRPSWLVASIETPGRGGWKRLPEQGGGALPELMPHLLDLGVQLAGLDETSPLVHAAVTKDTVSIVLGRAVLWARFGAEVFTFKLHVPGPPYLVTIPPHTRGDWLRAQLDDWLGPRETVCSVAQYTHVAALMEVLRNESLHYRH